MEILEVYDKTSDLRYMGKNIFDAMDMFFCLFPKKYSKNYYRNLKSLKLFKVDDFYDNELDGYYDMNNNTLFFSDVSVIGHELMHMASYDVVKGNYAFDNNDEDISNGFIEGMTEYLTIMLWGENYISSYYFETFCASMLSNIDGIIKSYFMPNYDNFINLFPNKKDIYSLMYSLGYYSLKTEKIVDVTDVDKIEVLDRLKIKEAIKNTINSLINIELSYEKDINNLIEYGDKFMDLITVDNVKEYLLNLCPEYLDYAYCQVKQRIRCKR